VHIKTTKFGAKERMEIPKKQKPNHKIIAIWLLKIVIY
jgi:hypothetical protein